MQVYVFCVSRSNCGGGQCTNQKESHIDPTFGHPRRRRDRITLLRLSAATPITQPVHIGLNALTAPPQLQLRNFEWTDIQGFFSLLRNAGPHGHRDWPETLEGVRAELGYPRVQPEKNVAVAEVAGDNVADISGYAIVEPEQNIGRSVVGIAGTAEYNGDELSGLLLDWAVGRAGECTPLAHLATRDHETELSEYVERTGWSRVRKYLKLESGPRPARAAAVIPDGFTVRTMLSLEELPQLTTLQNEAFNEHFGFSPNTVDEIKALLLGPDASIDDIVFIHDSAQRLVAYCWTQTGERAGTKFGRIGMTGVLPEVRGQGLGRAVAESGFNHLLGEGVDTI